MYRFKRLAMDVDAVQVGSNGAVKIGNRDFIGSPGFWIVVDQQGTQTNWSDEDFRKYFKPADDEAEAYLLLSRTQRKDETT
jgi:hypothetical protein